jgi:hypothetical protein
MNDAKITLPPLPPAKWLGYDPERGDVHGHVHGHSFDVMREFARAAVLLDRQQRAAPSAEPVAWLYEADGHLGPHILTQKRWTDVPEEWTETALYTTPPAHSAEPKPALAERMAAQACADAIRWDLDALRALEPPPAALSGEGEVTRLVRWLTAPRAKGAK